MIERIHDRQNNPQGEQTPNHWLIPTAGALRIASAALNAIITCIGLVMMVQDQDGAKFLGYGSALISLMGLPALLVLTRALRPHEPRRAIRAFAAGGSIYLIQVGLNALILSDAISPVMEMPVVNVSLTALAVFVALWVIWLVWTARSHDILHGALPWFGLAANIVPIIYAVLRAFRDLFPLAEFAEILLVLSLLLIYVIGTLLSVIWDFWLGLVLVRGRITASASVAR